MENMASKSKRVCQECGKKYYARNYCKKHYWQLWRKGKFVGKSVFDPNEIIIKGSIAEVILCNVERKEVARVIIDAEDVEKVKKYKWHLNNGYAETNVKGNRKHMAMQHIIMGIPRSRKKQIDHRNNNPLINKKSNLRFSTQAENARNGRISRSNTSGYKGVYRSGKKWRAQIGSYGKSIYLGSFMDKVSAAKAYNLAAVKYFGEFARINILQGVGG